VFNLEAVTLSGLVRYHVLFVIDLASRRVEIAGIVHQPHEAWMLQIARNLTDVIDGFLLGKRYLIMDRDPLFTHDFRAMLAAVGVKSVRLPSRSPSLNAFAERFVRSASVSNHALRTPGPRIARCGGLGAKSMVSASAWSCF
jgi:transposase InsO family protein